MQDAVCNHRLFADRAIAITTFCPADSGSTRFTPLAGWRESSMATSHSHKCVVLEDDVSLQPRNLSIEVTWGLVLDNLPLVNAFLYLY